MKNMYVCSIFLLFVALIDAFPCPPECICQPLDMIDVDFTRMTYTMDCSHASFNDSRLVYRAEPWSVHEDKVVDNDEDDEPNNDYIISIDLSNASGLTSFNNRTIELTGFSFRLQSLAVTSQSTEFILQSNAFNSSLFDNLKVLNLSSCCRQIPIECQRLFAPLSKLEVLDLSGSDMYKNCLDKPGQCFRHLFLPFSESGEQLWSELDSLSDEKKNTFIAFFQPYSKEILGRDAFGHVHVSVRRRSLVFRYYLFQLTRSTSSKQRLWHGNVL